MKIDLTGVGIALITPFTKDGSIDYNALGRLIDHVIDSKADYLVALGTTAETPVLNTKERKEVTEFIIKHNNSRLPLVIGIGGNCTEEVVEAMKSFDLSKFAALLSVTPYYNKPSQEGMYHHYAMIAKASPIPVILYNVPGRTGINLAAETVIKLANDFENIIAVKEASGNMTQAMYILSGRPQGFQVISGDDNLTLPLISMGAEGVISVAGNAFPMFCELVHDALEGNFKEASKKQMLLHKAVDALFEDGNPSGIKTALSIKGIIENNLRLPLVPAKASVKEKLNELIEKNKL